MRILKESVVKEFEPLINQMSLDQLEDVLKKDLAFHKSYLSTSTLNTMLFTIRTLIMMKGLPLSKEHIVFIISLEKLLKRFEDKRENIKI